MALKSVGTQSGGGVTQIMAGVGLSGGTITGTGTISVSAGFGLSAQSGTLQTTVTVPIPGNGTPPAL